MGGDKFEKHPQSIAVNGVRIFYHSFAPEGILLDEIVKICHQFRSPLTPEGVLDMRLIFTHVIMGKFMDRNRCKRFRSKVA